MTNSCSHHEELGETCLLRGSRPEVSRNGGDDFVLVTLGECKKSVETMATHGERRIALSVEGSSLDGQQPFGVAGHRW